VSNKNNDMEVDKAAALKEWKHKAVVTVIFWIGFFLFVYGVIAFSGSFIEQGYNFNPPDFSQLHEVNGIFDTARSSRLDYYVVVDNNTNSRYTCKVGCGFEDYLDTRSKNVKALVYDKYIYQIEVDSVVKVDYAKRIKYLTIFKYTGIKFLVPGIIVLILGQIYKRRQRREANG